MRPGHWIAIDGVVGAMVALAAVFAGPNGPDADGLDPPIRTLLATAVFLSVTLRRRNPVAAFCALILLSILSVGAGRITTVLILFATAYVLYLTTVASSRRTGFAALTLAIIVTVVLLITHQNLDPGNGGGGIYVPVAFALIISWMTGYSVRQRRAYAAMLQHQAASSAVAEERLRIARELHDVVAHSMSVIAVQAGYGQYVIDSSPSDARDALGAIQATSRDALEEMRRMLGVLRQQDADGARPGRARPDAGSGARPAPPEPGAALSAAFSSAAVSPAAAPLAPAPGLGDLDRLIQRTSGAGIHVTLRRSGHIRAVPAGVDLSAYRIIQEALTNVVKHAGADAHCKVNVSYGDDAIEIWVIDDGGQSLVLAPAGTVLAPTDAALAPSSGHGLIGMRERVHLCGGEFSAGPLGSGGFQVAATLPLHGGDQ
jgi:signal transduction histidine kinase